MFHDLLSPFIFLLSSKWWSCCWMMLDLSNPSSIVIRFTNCRFDCVLIAINWWLTIAEYQFYWAKIANKDVVIVVVIIYVSWATLFFFLYTLYATVKPIRINTPCNFQWNKENVDLWPTDWIARIIILVSLYPELHFKLKMDNIFQIKNTTIAL